MVMGLGLGLTCGLRVRCRGNRGGCWWRVKDGMGRGKGSGRGKGKGKREEGRGKGDGRINKGNSSQKQTGKLSLLRKGGKFI